MKQGSFADACPKLEESERIDPAVGTLLYLGECFERVGKTASAWATFREAASLATTSNQADRARIASARAQEIEPKLSRLSIELSPEVAQIPGVTVKRGAQRIEPSLYGTPLPVDPGEYQVQVAAPGYEAWETPIRVEAGGASASVRVPALIKSKESAVPSSNGPQPVVTDVPRSPLEPPPPAAPPSMTTQRIAGLVVGGVGVVGLGIGGYFGIRAIVKNSDAETHCPKGALCNDTMGVELSNKARRAATASNIAFAAGGVLVASGLLLYVTGGSHTSDRVALVPVVGPGTAAASLSGSF